MSTGGDLPGDVLPCMARLLQAISFPKPEQGIATVSFPASFEPGK